MNDALRVVRNEIHDVAPVIVLFRTRWGAPQVGLAFHELVGAPVTDALNKLADRGNRGIERLFSDGHVIQPDTFLQFVLPWMFSSVDLTLSALLPMLPEREPVGTDSMLDAEAVGGALDATTRLNQAFRDR